MSRITTGVFRLNAVTGIRFSVLLKKDCPIMLWVFAIRSLYNTEASFGLTARAFSDVPINGVMQTGRKSDDASI